jgi:hypothetical protein
VYLTLTHPAEQLSFPKYKIAGIVEKLLWVFMFSFALDYRNTAARLGGDGTGFDQLLFLGLCASSSLSILWLGRHYLTVRPGAWLLLAWGAFLTFMLANAFAQGVDPSRSIRVAMPLIFCFFGMISAHIASCLGLSPLQIVNPLVAAACVNVIWRILSGFTLQDHSLETLRFEVQSPAVSWLAAWLGCSILLRRRFHWDTFVVIGILFLSILITVTRSLILPVTASVLAATFCFTLGVLWRQFEWRTLRKLLLPGGVGFLFIIFPLLITALNHTGNRNLSTDISLLTRAVEADALRKIVAEDSLYLIHGRGIGSSYYWDPAYLPEIAKVLPSETIQTDDIWFAGHSVWTYSLFSGGVIALAAFTIVFGATSAFSLIGARANSGYPGPGQWLAFLPFVATFCLISETFTSNPFQEPLTGIIFGVMAGLPQAFIVRSTWVPAIAYPAKSA